MHDKDREAYFVQDNGIGFNMNCINAQVIEAVRQFGDYWMALYEPPPHCAL